MKKFLTLTALTIALLSAYSQNTYYKKVTQLGHLNLNDGIVTSDNNSIIIGSINNGLSIGSPFIAKMDVNGDTIWTKTFLNLGTRISSSFNKVVELANGNLIASGAHVNVTDQTEPIVIEISPSGAVINEKKFPINFLGNYGMIAPSTAIIETDGVNSFVAYGSGWNDGGFPRNSYGYLNIAKLDQNLDTLWTKKMDLTPEISFDMNVGLILHSIKLTNTGAIVLLYQAQTGTGIIPNSMPYFVSKLSNTGDLINSYKLTTTDNRKNIYLSSITILDNHNMYLTGQIQSDLSSLTANASILELDSNLNIVNKAVYFDTRGTSEAMIQLTNGDFLMALSGSSFAPLTQKPAIVKFDANLNMKWIKQYGSASTTICNIDVDQNKNIHLFGGSRIFSTANYFSGLILKADSNGIIPSCIESFNSLNIDSMIVLQTATANYIISADTITTTTSIAPSAAIIETESLEISFTDSIIQPLCNGQQGAIDLTMLSANTPHIFTWSNGTSAEDLSDFSSTYSVIITDKHNCVHLDTFNLIEPNVIGANFTSTNVNCFGAANGTIDLTVTGGTPGYTYSWTNLASTEDLTNLSGGFYQVTISDTNGCQKVVGISVTEPQQLISVVTKTTHASCNNVCDGELVCFASGGMPPYTYLWNDVLAQTTDTAIGLCDGQYFATITDSNGCQTYVNGMVTEPIALTSSMWESPTECGLSNGAAGVTPNGGTLPYSIVWWGTSVTNDTITGRDFGQSGVNVIDGNGCLLRDSIDITTTTLGNEECLVSVSASNQNRIIWEKPIASNISGYNIYRNVASTYTLIAFHPYDSLSEYTDLSFGVDPNVTSYRYKVSVVDTCGFESGLSFYHETIHLTANLGVGGEVNLIWDDYEGASFSSYNIMLDSTGTGNYNLLASVAVGSFTYTHLTPPQDSAEYIIEVVLDSTCTSTQKANHNTTRSNKGKVQSVSTGIIDQVLHNSVIYPNPAKNLLNIQLPGAKTWSYQVFNVVGKLVTETTNIDSENKTLNIEAWPKGMYIINLQIGKQSINKKIVKH